MCGPATPMIAMAAISAISTGISIHQNNKAVEAEMQAAVDAQAADNVLIDEQMGQVEQAKRIDQLERSRQAARERAMLRTAHSESGIAGASPMREIYDTFLQENYDMGIIETNAENAKAQASANGKAIAATAQGRVNAAKSRAVSPGMGALQIGLSGAQGAMQGASMSSLFAGDASSRVGKMGIPTSGKRARGTSAASGTARTSRGALDRAYL